LPGKEQAYTLKGKDKRTVNKKGKYKQEKKEASYEKQKKASDKVNKHTNNLYSAQICNVFRTHQVLVPTWGASVQTVMH